MIWAKTSTQNNNCLPDIKLTGQLVYLRPPKLSDWQNWNVVRSKNQLRLKLFEPTWPPDCLSEDFFKRRLRRQIRDWDHDRAQSFLIFNPTNSSLIGGININNITRGAAQYASLGYWIDQGHEGRGLMKETIGLVIHHCFTTLGLHRVNASCIVDNKRSQALLLKCGFEEEGFAKRYLKINGLWQDHILFGTCIEDYTNLQRSGITTNNR